MFFIIFIFLGITTNAVAGAYDEGLKAYKGKCYIKALELFLVDAKAGKAEAQLEAGKLLHTTYVGSLRNNKESAMWVRSAAKLGYLPAQNELGSRL
jgi:TPR repeat protein